MGAIGACQLEKTSYADEVTILENKGGGVIRGIRVGSPSWIRKNGAAGKWKGERGRKGSQ